MLVAFIVLAVLFLAYSNGANDNFKSVATLFGSGTASYRRSLAWATVTTVAGSLLALWLAAGLLKAFQGKEFVSDEVAARPDFLLAVSLGAACTIALATRLGLPVSTTHALTGALLGAGWLAAEGEVHWSVLGQKFLLPLLASPLLALTLTLLLYPIFRRTRTALGVSRQTCVCVGAAYEAVAPLPDGTLHLVRTGAVLAVGETSQCVERYQGRLFGIEAGKIFDAMHYLSAGAVALARGLNDTPKIVALWLGGAALHPYLGLALVAAAMAIGGLLNARRVAETMSHKITNMNPGQGFTANLVTALLVTLASKLGLPVSTTHVAVGGLFGIGVVTRTARAKTILSILLAWVTTLPMGAAAAACVFTVIGLF
jgi:PiT family inorganic phosphate transporter